jgi:hypothetical protein
VVAFRPLHTSAPAREKADGITDAEGQTESDKSLVQKVKGAAWGGVVVGGVGVLWVASSAVLSTIGKIYSSPHLIAYFGFWAGSITTTCLAAVTFGAYRLTFIKPENVFNQTAYMVKNNEEVKKVLGKQIMTDKRKTYELSGGGLFVEGGLVKYRPHAINISYLVYGTDKVALVTARAKKVMSLVPGNISMDVLAIQVLEKGGNTTIMLAGDPSDLEYQQSIYSIVQEKLA